MRRLPPAARVPEGSCHVPACADFNFRAPAPSRRQWPNVVPGTNTKGRKRFRLVFSPQALHFQTLFFGAVKGQAALVAAEIAVPPGTPEAGPGEIVLVNERYGIRLTRVVPASERLENL